MPTQRRRHTITETEPVQTALDEVRSAGLDVDMSDLVIRGARQLLAESEARAQADAERAQRRQQFLERTRTGKGLDINAALAARDAWTR